MLSIQNDFSHFDRIDWATKFEVSIRFLVELLAHTYGKKPEQIIKAFCHCNEPLPRLRYEEEEFDDSSDPQWMLFRYHTVLHTKVLLSNTLESSTWGLVQSISLSCLEEIKYKSATYPSASNEEIIFQSEGLEANGVGSITRIVTPPRDIPLEECWIYRREVEQYLASNRTFDGWIELLPISVKESESEHVTSISQGEQPSERPRWDFRPRNSKLWSIGSIDAPKTIKKMGGFFVIRSGLLNPGIQLSPHGIEVAPHPYNIADDVPRTGIKQTTEGYLHEDLSNFVDDTDGFNYVENMAGMPIMDATEVETNRVQIREFDRELSEIESELASSPDKITRERLEEKKKGFEDLRNAYQREIDKNTRPGGRSKTDDTGDADIVETDRLRASVRRAIQKLRDNDLNDIANHLTDHFDVAERLVIYEPIPDAIPKWSLDLPAPVPPQAKD